MLSFLSRNLVVCSQYFSSQDMQSDGRLASHGRRSKPPGHMAIIGDGPREANPLGDGLVWWLRINPFDMI